MFFSVRVILDRGRKNLHEKNGKVYLVLDSFEWVLIDCVGRFHWS